MSQNSSNAPLFAALGVVALLLVANLALFASGEPEAPSPEVGPQAEPAPPSAPEASEKPKYDRSRSVSLPRPAPKTPEEADGVEVSEEAPAAGGGGVGGGAEGGGDAPKGQVQAEDIRAAIQEVVPGIQECMDAWWAVDPQLEGRVVMDFTLTPEGLGEVAVLEHDQVPFGVQTCFASAIYEADWPRPEVGELQVTYPFVFFQVDEEEGVEVDTGG